jgi:5-methylcytosine-specific restriction protein A
VAPVFDARTHLAGLVGSTIATVTGQPNTVLGLADDHVLVATGSTGPSGGAPVPVEDVQRAGDLLFERGEIRVHPEEIGYRSAFVGAALATLEGVEALQRPARLRLTASGQGGRRNPPWAYDELILALDLYWRRGLLDDTDEEVIDLSEVLNRLPLGDAQRVDERYRNPNGVAMKLGNFARLDPNYAGSGLSRGGQAEVEVWQRYESSREELARIAAQLRAVAAGNAPPPPATPEEGEAEAREGRLLYRHHRVRERDRGLVRRKKDAAREATGKLVCEVCGIQPNIVYGELGDPLIECHHLLPLSELGTRRTRLSDLALVCRNCHGAIHAGGTTHTLEAVRHAFAAPG